MNPVDPENELQMRRRRGRRLIVFGVLLMAFALLAFLVIQPAMEGYGGRPADVPPGMSGSDTASAVLPAITSLIVAVTGLLSAVTGLLVVLKNKTPPQAGR